MLNIVGKLEIEYSLFDIGYSNAFSIPSKKNTNATRPQFHPFPIPNFPN